MNNEFIAAGAVSEPGRGNISGALVLGASVLSDYGVYDRTGEKLGTIKEIMLDVREGKVRYAVLSFGGFLGMGEKLFAVPWSALTPDSVEGRFVLDVDIERLKQAPGFDKDRWPDMADATWAREIHSYYGFSTDQTH